MAHDGFSQRDVKRADFVSELLEKYLEPYLTYLEQVKDRDKDKSFHKPSTAKNCLELFDFSSHQ